MLQILARRRLVFMVLISVLTEKVILSEILLLIRDSPMAYTVLQEEE